LDKNFEKRENAMKKKNTLPALTNFADTHDGEHDKSVFLAAIETAHFTDPVQPLQTFTNLRTELIQVAEQPANVIPIFESHTAGMTDAQKLFIAQSVSEYFSNTVFAFNNEDLESEGKTLTGIIQPLRAYIARLKRATTTKASDLRAILKEIVHKELEALPDTLAKLGPIHRLNFTCKVMGYVLPKVEAVNFKQGESDTWD